jgi:hypothetical protein
MAGNMFRPRPEINFPQQAAVYEFLTPEIVFVYPPGNKVVVQYQQAERVATLLTRGRVVDFDNAPEGLFEMIFDGRERICGEDIMDAYEDLSWERVRKMLIALYDLGVLALPES